MTEREQIFSGLPATTYKVSGLNWPETLGGFTLMGPANRLGSWRWYQRRTVIDGAQIIERMKVEGLGGTPIWESFHTIAPSHRTPMTDHHRATDQQWARQRQYSAEYGDTGSSCILELRDRIETLESMRQPATSPRLTPEDLGDYAYTDPIANKALRAGMTQAELIHHLLVDRAELLKQLFDARAHELPRPIEVDGKSYIFSLASASTRLLIDRVARAIYNGQPGAAAKARLAIREVAEWMREHGWGDPGQPDALMREADR